MAAPDPNNIFQWYFIIFGLPEEPYKGGYYMGSLNFPFEYPWKPPTMKMITKSGRFYVNKSICLSITNYHPESWDPIWPVKSLIVALISFFVSDDMTAGAIPYCSNQER